jgi:hypothetical protein
VTRSVGRADTWRVVWCLGEDKRCASVAGEARGERLRWAGSLEDRAAGQGVVLMLLVRAGEARVPRGQERGARRGKTRVGRTCMWATVGRAGIILAWRGGQDSRGAEQRPAPRIGDDDFYHWWAGPSRP